MAPFVGAAGLAFGAVFLAEFGDKSQLLILAFATRYAWRPIVLGLVLAAATIQALSVLVGAAVGAVLPTDLVAIVAGIAFLGVAGWSLHRAEDEDEDRAEAGHRPSRVGAGLMMAVAATFVVAELGDKTMLATFALAASQGPLPTWIGSTLGEVAANLLAVGLGRQMGARLSPRLIGIGSATLFAIAGVLVLGGALLG